MIVVIVRTASKLRSTAWAISLGLVLGGAAGNLVDRLFRSPAPLRGWVVDWISLRAPDGRMLFPIFNLADSGIVCGGILAVLLALLGYEMDGTRGGRDKPGRGPARAGAPAGAGPVTRRVAGPVPVRSGRGRSGRRRRRAPSACPVAGPRGSDRPVRCRRTAGPARRAAAAPPAARYGRTASAAPARRPGSAPGGGPGG